MTLHDVCKDYDLCTPETRAELEKNGFDFTVCKFGITEFIAGRMKTGFIAETNGVIPYPTFAEVWRLLPEEINVVDILNRGKSFPVYKNLYRNSVFYHYEESAGIYHFIEDNNICNAACLMWIKLKKGGLLNS